MRIDVERVDVNAVLPLRELRRHEADYQIIHDSFPQRGFSDAYLIRLDGRTAGYGLVANKHWPDTVHEFHTLPSRRAFARPMFGELLTASGALHILAQSNDPLMLEVLHDFGEKITVEKVLFADAFTSDLPCPGGRFRKVEESEKAGVFEHTLEPKGDWIIELEGEAVATGGILFHYNPPFGDLFMEVQEAHQRRGFGSYLIQELKRICYEMGKVPAARCNVTNLASRKTLEKAGLLPCGRLLTADVVH